MKEKIEEATENLGQKKIEELVGYKSYSNFNLMLKKYYGCSPSHYLELD